MFHTAHWADRGGRLWIAPILAVAVIIVFGVTSLGGRGVDWSPIVEALRSGPSPELLAELVHQVLERFSGEVTERILPLLDPQQTILYCAGTGCLGLVLVTPPRVLVAGQTRAGVSRAYNQGEILGLLGTFGNTIAPGLEGFFLLTSNLDGSVGVIDENGEEVTVLGAFHAFRVETAAVLDHRFEEGSVLLSGRTSEITVEIEDPIASLVAEERLPVQIRIGTADEDGLFSGVALCGAIPITVP